MWMESESCQDQKRALQISLRRAGLQSCVAMLGGGSLAYQLHHTGSAATRRQTQFSCSFGQFTGAPE